jgi:hypothetical protein
MYKGTSRVTFWGCGSSNTGDTHNEPFRAGVWPVPDNLHVVVGHGRNHNSPVHSSAQGPPRGLCLAIRREIHQAIQLPILEAIQPAKQRRIRLPKRLLKRRAIQRRIRLAIQVTTQVAIQAQTHVPTQRATQSSMRPAIRRDVLRETQGTFRRAFRRAFTRPAGASFQFPVSSLAVADSGRRTADSGLRLTAHGARFCRV